MIKLLQTIQHWNSLDVVGSDGQKRAYVTLQLIFIFYIVMKKDFGFLHLDHLPYDTLKVILILAKPFLNSVPTLIPQSHQLNMFLIKPDLTKENQ